MERPLRKRQAPGKLTPAPSGLDLVRLSEMVSYVGSPEHKRMPTFAGQPRPYADASICSKESSTDRKVPNGWLRDAILSGSVGAPWEGEFPRYVWAVVDGQPYEGRLVNREKGEYKGYPIGHDELPDGLRLRS